MRAPWRRDIFRVPQTAARAQTVFELHVTHLAALFWKEPQTLPTLFDTNDAPADKRFTRWREAASTLFVPVDVATSSPDTFRYRSWRSSVDNVNLGTSAARSFHVTRGATHIAHSSQDPVSIYIPTHGEIAISQNGRKSCVRPGEAVVVDQDIPYEMDIRREFEFLWLHVPRELLLHRLSDVYALGGACFSTHNPYVSLAANFASQLARVADQIAPGHSVRMAEHLLDLFAMALSKDGAHVLPARSVRRTALLHRAQTCIDRNLYDPALSLARVAAEVGVSARPFAEHFDPQADSRAADRAGRNDDLRQFFSLRGRRYRGAASIRDA